MDVTTESILHWRAAGIPHRLQVVLEQSRQWDELAESTPVYAYEAKVADGGVIRGNDYRTCGVGLWVVGDKADLLVAGLLQRMLLLGEVSEARWVSADDLIQMRLDDDADFGQYAKCDMLVLQGVGSHHRSVSGWSDSVISSLLRRRFDNGLPTLVTSGSSPEASGVPQSIADEAFDYIDVG